MQLKISDLYELQDQLDSRILDIHGLKREETSRRRLLALLVELAECVNETRCFKFWSLKGPNQREVILEEFVDGIHFLLSAGLDLHDSSTFIESHEVNADLTEAYLQMYADCIALMNDYSLHTYYQCFQTYLGIGELMGFNAEEIRTFYFAKNQENHNRQDTNY